jgi:Creatinase/Prolidase N-terminal domain
MRRGLMAWDSDEIPIAALRRRVERLQTALVQANQDAIILYTNFVRSGAVSYLTAFSPYWADGVLLVSQQGDPVFATTLSKRVGSWIQSVKPIGELINTPTPAKALAERLATQSKMRRVAVLELDNFPSGLYGELAAALPDVEIVDGSESFAAARSTLDTVERRLLENADVIAKNALEHLTGHADVGAAVGAAEIHARLRGAEEVYVAIGPDLDADRRFIRLSGPRPLGRRFAIRATVAYKGTWVRRIKTYSRDNGDRTAIGRADAWFEALLPSIDASWSPHEQIGAAVATLPDAQLVSWIAEASVGTNPLAVVASSGGPCETARRLPALILSVELSIDGMPWCGAGLSRSTNTEGSR